MIHCNDVTAAYWMVSCSRKVRRDTNMEKRHYRWFLRFWLQCPFSSSILPFCLLRLCISASFDLLCRLFTLLLPFLLNPLFYLFCFVLLVSPFFLFLLISGSCLQFSLLNWCCDSQLRELFHIVSGSLRRALIQNLVFGSCRIPVLGCDQAVETRTSKAAVPASQIE